VALTLNVAIESEEDEEALAESIRQDLAAQLGIDPSRIEITGLQAGSAMVKAKIRNEIPSHCDGIDLEDPEHADKTECKSANKLFEALADDVASGDMQFSKGEVVEGSFRALDDGASQCLAIKEKDERLGDGEVCDADLNSPECGCDGSDCGSVLRFLCPAERPHPFSGLGIVSVCFDPAMNVIEGCRCDPSCGTCGSSLDLPPDTGYSPGKSPPYGLSPGPFGFYNGVTRIYNDWTEWKESNPGQPTPEWFWPAGDHHTHTGKVECLTCLDGKSAQCDWNPASYNPDAPAPLPEGVWPIYECKCAPDHWHTFKNESDVDATHGFELDVSVSKPPSPTPPPRVHTNQIRCWCFPITRFHETVFLRVACVGYL
jgi:hypothetical protein